MTQAVRIQKARLGVILDAPFFGSLLMRLKMVRDDSVPTFCVDGCSIMYNEKFSAGLSDLELKGILVHEVAHVAQGHLWRMGSWEPQRFNVAADYAINGMLDEYLTECKAKSYAVPYELPKGGCLDQSLSKDRSSEEIYNLLPSLPPGGGGSGNPGSSPGEFKAPQDPAQTKALESEWKVATVQAAQAAKMMGNCPACVRRLVEELLEPKVPWREVLRQFIRQQAREDYAWTRPARRYLHQGVILPGMYSERMGKLIVAVDTSGSIDAKALAEFQAEAQAALDECRPESMEVVYCDARVHGSEEFYPGDLVRLELKGGGGTNFRPVFDHVAATGDEPAALVYLTDGFGLYPEAPPDYPVLWAITGDFDRVPWGETVAIQ